MPLPESTVQIVIVLMFVRSMQMRKVTTEEC